MFMLFFLLLIISIVVLIVGMFMPKQTLKFMSEDKRDRKNVLKVFGSAALVSFILLGITVGDSDIEDEPVAKEEEVEVVEVEEEFLTLSESEKDLLSENMGLGDGSYIVLPHLIWNVSNKEKMTREMLERYSDTIAVRLADESDISEITVFWEVPYHREDTNIAKFMYERVNESNKGIAKVDTWYDPIIR